MNESNGETDDEEKGMKEEPKVGELDDYGKLVKAIEGRIHMFEKE